MGLKLRAWGSGFSLQALWQLYRVHVLSFLRLRVLHFVTTVPVYSGLEDLSSGSGALSKWLSVGDNWDSYAAHLTGA